MRPVRGVASGVLVGVLAVVAPAYAGRMLIAAAATDGHLDRYCLRNDGSFADHTPRSPIGLRSPNPHGMVFVPEDRPGQTDAGVLYVMEQERVEAFRFGPGGDVAQHCGESGTDACRGQTMFDSHTDARAVAVNPATRTLYVAERGLDRVTAYPLDDNGLPPKPPDTGVPFISCIQSKLGSGLAGLVFQDGRLYVAAESGRVDVFGTVADGGLCSCAPCIPSGDNDCTNKQTCAATDPCIPTTSAECPTKGTNVNPTTPLLQRRKLSGPTSLFIIDGMLFVQEANYNRLSGFRIQDLQPVQPIKSNGKRDKVCVDGPNLGQVCKPANEAAQCAGFNCGDTAPRRATRTGQQQRYQQMVQAGPETIIGSQFSRGRIDAFRLQEASSRKSCHLGSCPGTGARCCLSGKPSSQSDEDLRMSPVGLTVASAPDGFFLYAAAGDDDRVRAYSLYPNGLFRTREQFDQTDEQNGSFPNAVAIAELSNGCR